MCRVGKIVRYEGGSNKEMEKSDCKERDLEQ